MANKKEETFNVWNVTVPIYNFSLVLVFAETLEETELKLSEVWEENTPGDPYRHPDMHDSEDTVGRSGYYPTQHPDHTGMPYISIVTKRKHNAIMATIAHECNHMAMYICKERGVKVGREHHEAFNYLSTYLMETILESYDKYKEWMEKNQKTTD